MDGDGRIILGLLFIGIVAYLAMLHELSQGVHDTPTKPPDDPSQRPAPKHRKGK